MDIRSLRMLLGWSREELAKRSVVSFASVYLMERMGTAGPEDDALITRALLEAHRRKSSTLLLGTDAGSVEHAHAVAAAISVAAPRSRPRWGGGRPPTMPCGDMDQFRRRSHACPGEWTQSTFRRDRRFIGGFARS